MLSSKKNLLAGAVALCLSSQAVQAERPSVDVTLASDYLFRGSVID